MQIDALRYFMTICDTGSIARAARQVNISQQGLSKTVKSLESELGTTLLVRARGDGSTPTAAGKELYRCAKEIIETWDETRLSIMQRYAADDSGIHGNHLRIIATTYVMNNLSELFRGAPVYGDLSADKGTLTLFETDYIDIGRSLLKSPENTVAIVNTCPALLGTMPESPLLEFEAFLESDILIACKRGFFPTTKKLLTKDDLVGIPFILHSDRVLTTIMEDYFGEGFNLMSKASDFERIASTVARGEAVTITDTLRESNRRLASRFTNAGNVVCLPIANPPKTIVGFVKPKAKSRLALCQHFEQGCMQRTRALHRNFTVSSSSGF